MKLKELLKHIPTNQYIRICERLKIVGIGFPTDINKDIQQHSRKTVSMFYIKDGILEINVYSK